MSEQLLTYEQSKDLCFKAATVFQPRTPISTRELFSGRWRELTTLVDAVSQAGLHVCMYGERGVGKTSLANVVRSVVLVFDDEREPSNERRLIIKQNANSGDSFSSIWSKLFDEITWEADRPSAGLASVARKKTSLRDAFGLPDKLSVDDVRRALIALPRAVFIIDEFDRSAPKTAQQFTDLIKSLSDFAVDCTVILVGVSSTIDELVKDHASIRRALVQILVTRMMSNELREILIKAEGPLGVQFLEDAAKLIVHVSQGLPHYTHLIGLNAVRMAASKRYSRTVKLQDVIEALKQAVTQAEQSVTENFSKAVHSAHRDALYKQVLLACALTAASSDEPLGYFNPGAIATSLNDILGRDMQIASYNNHLAEFCQEKRGMVLERTGQPRAYRFRFR